MKLVDIQQVPAPLAEKSFPLWMRLLRKSSYRLILLLLVLGALILISENGLLPSLGSRLQTFVTIFLSIFIEAAPFLLAGSIVSGFIEVFVNRDQLYRFVPRDPILAALTGGALGIFFPVCECGVVPVTRRLYQKGLPLSMGIAFLLAAPVVNPVVVASTYAAFGWGPILWGRLGFSFLIAVVVGGLSHFAKPQEIILPESTHEGDASDHHHDHSACCDHDQPGEVDTLPAIPVLEKGWVGHLRLINIAAIIV